MNQPEWFTIVCRLLFIKKIEGSQKINFENYIIRRILPNISGIFTLY